MGRDVDDRRAGERILFAQSIEIGELHRRRDFGAKRIAVVDRGCDDRAFTTLDGPPCAGGRYIGQGHCR